MAVGLKIDGGVQRHCNALALRKQGYGGAVAAATLFGLRGFCPYFCRSLYAIWFMFAFVGAGQMDIQMLSGSGLQNRCCRGFCLAIKWLIDSAVTLTP